MKTFEVTLRVRNNRLKQRREELGKSLHEMAEMVGLSYCTLCAMESMRYSPWNKEGEWKPASVKIAEFHGCSLDELFPEAIKRIKKVVVTKRIDEREMLAIASASDVGPTALLPCPDEMFEEAEMRSHVHDVLATLTPCEEKILRMRFGIGEATDHTLEQIGQDFNRSRERIREIEAKVLYKLRRPSIAKYLKDFVEGEK